MNFYNIRSTIHEMGHAFHSFFSDNETKKDTFGWDLIELPSQFLENLAYRYDFLSKISSSPYLSKRVFKEEINNLTFNDILYLYKNIVDFKTSFELNKNINPYSNKRLIKKIIKKRHSVGNYRNPFSETEHSFNCNEYDYFANYIYFFSENIAKELALIYDTHDFRELFENFDLDKREFKDFLQSKFDINQVDLIKMFSYSLFNK